MAQCESFELPQNPSPIEKMMEKMGCTGDRVKASHIHQRIETLEFRELEAVGQRFMFCFIRMQGGFVATGKSVCMDAANYRELIGRRVSFEDAFDTLWELEAYRKMSS